jgi:hypothetical protein
MKRFWILKSIKVLAFAILAIVAFIAFGYVVMWLWNWVVPAVTGFHSITFVQALALLALSRIFFGGFRRHGGGRHWRHRIRDRWDQMTPEQRERFRDCLGPRHRCGQTDGSSPPASEAAK